MIDQCVYIYTESAKQNKMAQHQMKLIKYKAYNTNYINIFLNKSIKINKNKFVTKYKNKESQLKHKTKNKNMATGKCGGMLMYGKV